MSHFKVFCSRNQNHSVDSGDILGNSIHKECEFKVSKISKKLVINCLWSGEVSGLPTWHDFPKSNFTIFSF